jgi:hypothetical protein
MTNQGTWYGPEQRWNGTGGEYIVFGNIKERDNLKDLSVGGNIILELVLKK